MAYRPPSIRPKQHVVLSPPTPPTLSPELWLMIWERTWEPRIVEVHSIIKFQSRDRMRLFDSEQYRSSAPLPFTLFINRKSRHFTQLHYRRGFPASFLDRDLCKHSRVYFNSKLDTLYLRDPDMFWTSNQLKRFRLCDCESSIQVTVVERRSWRGWSFCSEMGQIPSIRRAHFSTLRHLPPFLCWQEGQSIV